MNIEELFLDAEADIKKAANGDALRKFESILYDEPGHAPTHNFLGWLYKTYMDDYKKAENHFKTAITSDPLFPHAYFHYAILLTEMERFDELEKHLQRCLTIATIEKSWVFFRMGVAQELLLNFEEATRFFERAVLISLNDDKIKEYRADIERCIRKLELVPNHADFIVNFRKQ